MKMKVSYPAIFLVFVLLLTAESSVAQQCNPTALTPCLPAFTGPDQPSQLCCTRLDQQKPCFCQYEKNPALQKYFNSPNAKKVSDACKIPIPKC
ncbi:hypothetical protein DCAR_0416091 [Daucus carota subsp. sativus]|uniref:Bifunctional inhibitor/plant lipid transfer protein/seed storage helical domain-containing protein n=1 Tax=Daucus carota subsp. sativus TaxID=79200 RepID=A0AAF0WVA6_DAUCS|nr:hypothetical protein DCAR_0416091 [Daucus carota subsp. sativus]